VRSLALDPLRRPRDLAWRRCNIELKDGTEGLVYLPVTYPAPPAGASDAIRLGRETAWAEQPDITRGLGQRLWLAGEEAVAAAEVTSLRFA
jgi:type VI secretion system protein ImpE